MALYKYFEKASVLPNPDGPLSARVPSSAIAEANKRVQTLGSYPDRGRGLGLRCMRESDFTCHSRNLLPSKNLPYTVSLCACAPRVNSLWLAQRGLIIAAVCLHSMVQKCCKRYSKQRDNISVCGMEVGLLKVLNDIDT